MRRAHVSSESIRAEVARTTHLSVAQINIAIATLIIITQHDAHHQTRFPFMAPPDETRISRIADIIDAVALFAHLVHRLHIRLEELVEYELGNLADEHKEVEEPLTAVIKRIHEDQKKKRSRCRRNKSSPATKKRPPPRDDDKNPPAKRSSLRRST